MVAARGLARGTTSPIGGCSSRSFRPLLPERGRLSATTRRGTIGQTGATSSTRSTSSTNRSSLLSVSAPIFPCSSSSSSSSCSFSVGLFTCSDDGRKAVRQAVSPREGARTDNRRSVTCCVGLGEGARDTSESKKVSKDVREKVEGALEALGYSVTVGDVASRCGISLLDAERALQALAIDSGATLSVSSEGEILYKFARNFRSVVRSKSLAIRLEPAIQKTKAVGAYLVRVGFGTALIASIAIVFAAIVVIATSSRSNDRDNRSSASFSPGFRLSPFDLYYPYWDPYYYRRRRERLAYGEEMNTLEAIFSFVFGDGDLNEDLDDVKWKAVGQIIRKSKGVVAAEQLAPFMIGEAKEEDPNNPLDKESFMLPVLQRFDGRAEVDEKGNIVYYFPELQKTASGTTAGALTSGYLEEKRWKFTNASTGQAVSAVALGVLNIVGIIAFTNVLATYNVPVSKVAEAYGGVVALAINLLPALKVYAAGFFAIPLFRWVFNRNTNKAIEDRNARRLLAYKRLQQLDPELRSKLQSAKRYGGTKIVSSREAVYTSEANMEEDMALDDFDRKLKEK